MHQILNYDLPDSQSNTKLNNPKQRAFLSLKVDDIPGARPKPIYIAKKTDHYPDFNNAKEEVYNNMGESMNFIPPKRISNKLYQMNMNQLKDKEMPQGKKQFDVHHDTQIKKLGVFQTYDQQNPLIQSYKFTRSLETNDIEGSKPGILNKVVKNFELAQKYRKTNIDQGDSLDKFQKDFDYGKNIQTENASHIFQMENIQQSPMMINNNNIGMEKKYSQQQLEDLPDHNSNIRNQYLMSQEPIHNHDHSHDHNHNHDHSHNHDHNHNYNHNQNHNHNHNHEILHNQHKGQTLAMEHNPSLDDYSHQQHHLNQFAADPVGGISGGGNSNHLSQYQPSGSRENSQMDRMSSSYSKKLKVSQSTDNLPLSIKNPINNPYPQMKPWESPLKSNQMEIKNSYSNDLLQKQKLLDNNFRGVKRQQAFNIIAHEPIQYKYNYQVKPEYMNQNMPNDMKKLVGGYYGDSMLRGNNNNLNNGLLSGNEYNMVRNVKNQTFNIIKKYIENHQKGNQNNEEDKSI